MKRFLACIMAVCLAVASIAIKQSYAFDPPEGWHMLSAKNAVVLAQSVMASDQYQALSSSLASAYTPEPHPIVLGHEDKAFVYYPIKYLGQYNGSLFMAVVDQKTGRVLETMTWLVEKVKAGHRAQVWLQGDLSIDVTIDDQGTVVAGWHAGAAGQREDATGLNLVKAGSASMDQVRSSLLGSDKGNGDVGTQSMRCLNDCLSNAGVPLFLITLVAMVCAIACAVTAGLGCAICLGGTLGAWLSVGTTCLRRCGYDF